MMLQPISPRRSGESATQVDMSCAETVFVVRIDSTAIIPAAHPQERVILLPPRRMPTALNTFVCSADPGRGTATIAQPRPASSYGAWREAETSADSMTRRVRDHALRS